MDAPAGLVLLQAKLIDDHLGFFMNTYRRPVLADFGIGDDFPEDNHSHSRLHVLRGLH